MAPRKKEKRVWWLLEFIPAWVMLIRICSWVYPIHSYGRSWWLPSSFARQPFLETALIVDGKAMRTEEAAHMSDVRPIRTTSTPHIQFPVPIERKEAVDIAKHVNCLRSSCSTNCLFRFLKPRDDHEIEATTTARCTSRRHRWTTSDDTGDEEKKPSGLGCT
jgi:hypothetical protein